MKTIRGKYIIKDRLQDTRQIPFEFIPCGKLFDYKDYRLVWEPDWVNSMIENKIIIKMIQICRNDDLKNWGGDLYLRSLTSIPEGVNVKAKHIYLKN